MCCRFRINHRQFAIVAVVAEHFVQTGNLTEASGEGGFALECRSNPHADLAYRAHSISCLAIQAEIAKLTQCPRTIGRRKQQRLRRIALSLRWRDRIELFLQEQSSLDTSRNRL